MMFYIVSHMDWVDSKELVHKFGFMGLGSYLIILNVSRHHQCHDIDDRELKKNFANF